MKSNDNRKLLLNIQKNGALFRILTNLSTYLNTYISYNYENPNNNIVVQIKRHAQNLDGLQQLQISRNLVEEYVKTRENIPE